MLFTMLKIDETLKKEKKTKQKLTTVQIFIYLFTHIQQLVHFLWITKSDIVIEIF